MLMCFDTLYHQLRSFLSFLKKLLLSLRLSILPPPLLPDGLIVSHMPYGPTAFFSLSNVVMRHDIPNTGTMSEAFPHLIFHNFTTTLGQRVRMGLIYTTLMHERLFA